MSRYNDRGDRGGDRGGGGGRRDAPNECKVYVGDLPREADEKDLERTFTYYGPLRSVWVARNPPGFAFVEFEDNRDAEDAVRALDGSNLCGSRVRVEHSQGKQRSKPWARRGGGGGGGGGRDGGRDGGRGSRDSRKAFDPTDKCFECGERGHYAYDCKKYGTGRAGSRRKRSRSRSYERRRRSYSRSRSRSRS